MKLLDHFCCIIIAAYFTISVAVYCCFLDNFFCKIIAVLFFIVANMTNLVFVAIILPLTCSLCCRINAANFTTFVAVILLLT